MARPLKTKFPCKHCGEPAEVTKLRYGEFARCPKCAERQRLYSLANYRDEECTRRLKKAHAAYNAAPDDRDSRAWLAELFRALGVKLEAAAHCMEAVNVAPDVPTQRHLVRVAVQRGEWVRDAIGMNVHHFSEAASEILEGAGFAVLKGDGVPDGLPADVAPRRVRLSVVRDS